MSIIFMSCFIAHTKNASIYDKHISLRYTNIYHLWNTLWNAAVAQEESRSTPALLTSSSSALENSVLSLGVSPEHSFIESCARLSVSLEGPGIFAMTSSPLPAKRLGNSNGNGNGNGNGTDYDYEDYPDDDEDNDELAHDFTPEFELSSIAPATPHQQQLRGIQRYRMPHQLMSTTNHSLEDDDDEEDDEDDEQTIVKRRYRQNKKKPLQPSSHHQRRLRSGTKSLDGGGGGGERRGSATLATTTTATVTASTTTTMTTTALKQPQQQQQPQQKNRTCSRCNRGIRHSSSCSSNSGGAAGSNGGIGVGGGTGNNGGGGGNSAGGMTMEELRAVNRYAESTKSLSYLPQVRDKFWPGSRISV